MFRVEKKILISFVIWMMAISIPKISFGKEAVLSNPVYGGTEDGFWEGDRIFFGSYEQDANEKNGKEPILWRILWIQGNKALLLSEYALDVKAYHQKSKKVTWKDSDVRKWLNTEFFEDALGGKDSWFGSKVKKTKCKNMDHVKYGTNAGSDTYDYIFLLSWEETFMEKYGFTKASEVLTKNPFQYGDVSYSRLCYPTRSCSLKNPLITRTHDTRYNHDMSVGVEGFGSIYWILRTPGSKQRYISYVSRWGRTTYTFDSPVNHLESCIRPALWIDLSDLNIKKIGKKRFVVGKNRKFVKRACRENKMGKYKLLIMNFLENEKKVEHEAIKIARKQNRRKLSNPVFGGNKKGEWEGDRVYFGRYSGKNILWRVLNKDDGKIILLSEYGIEKMQYSENRNNIWEKSKVRNWLNNEFYREAFSGKERRAVLLSYIKNEKNQIYGISNGRDTRDHVFLLSWEECMKEEYGFTKSDHGGPCESMTRIV